MLQGYDSSNKKDALEGNPAPEGAYNEENNTWSVVEQKYIPPSKLSAVEIEGKVFFVISEFPVDSAIRIPPRELYPVQKRASESVSVQFSFLLLHTVYSHEYACFTSQCTSRLVFETFELPK